MNADELDGYGEADLAIKAELRREGGRPPSKAQRLTWAAWRAKRQAETSLPVRETGKLIHPPTRED